MAEAAAPQSTFKVLWSRSLEKLKERDLLDLAAKPGEAKSPSSPSSRWPSVRSVLTSLRSVESGGEKEVASPNSAATFGMAEAGALVYRVVAWKKCLARNLKVAEEDEALAAERQQRDALAFLTRDWIAAALAAHCPPGQNVLIDDFATESVGEGLGFLSKAFRITLTYKNEASAADLPKSLILKIGGTHEECFQVVADETDAYRREHSFYSEIVPILKEKKAKMRVPLVYTTTLVEGGARILMEDLGEIGFSVNQCDGLTKDQVAPLVAMAADMHAAFWPGCEGAAVIPNNVVKGEDRRSFIRRWNDGFSRQSRYEEFVASKGLKVYDIGVSEEVVLEIGAKVKANAAKILHHLTVVAPQTLIHADYRADNMILLHSGSCAVLDWQLHCTGPGAYDLTDIMVKSMKAADGVSCSEELLRHYHACLVAAGVKDYSWEQLNTDFRFSCLQQIMLVFDIGLDGIGADGQLIDDWLAFDLLRCMFKRLVTAIVDLKCLDLLN
mmetsp:Transcript_35096/g.76072  ORF Transcript_35096/g.76072 Transcript_35096/m.76072 type:complete len:499 (-) Transcript_35096:104-1600(-)